MLAGLMVMGGSAVFAGAAEAQELVLYGTGAVDGNSTGIGLVGASARLGNLGLQPVLGLQAFYLTYDVLGGETESRVGVNPQAGLALRGNSGQVEARVGYSLVSGGDDEEDTPVVEGGGGGGFNTTLQGNYWGPGPELQGIGYFAVEEDYVWTQLQAAVPVVRSAGGGRLSLGAEGVWESDVGDGEYRSFSVGPLARFDTGRNFAVTVSGGLKDNTLDEGTWYARLGLVRYGLPLPF